jgi:hypothetical protein
MRVEIVDEKRVRLYDLYPIMAQCLQEIPTLLEKREDPRAQLRLYPAPTEAEEKANHDWQEFILPELRHLFVTAGEVLARDLIAMESSPSTAVKPGDPEMFQVIFLAQHLPAWMSALNEARLILGSLHSVDESDMNDYQSDWLTPKRQAVLKIHILADVLEQLVRFEMGEMD